MPDSESWKIDALSIWKHQFSQAQYTQLWQFTVPFSLNVASSDQTVLLMNSSSLCTLCWNNSQNCIFLIRIIFIRGIWDVNFPFSMFLECVIHWFANSYLMWTFMWWLYKLFQHHNRRGRTHLLCKASHIMHYTVSLRFVANTCNCWLCWRFCCKFTLPLFSASHMFSNLQYHFKIILHCSNDDCSTAIYYDCPAIWQGGSGIHLTITIFWENNTLHTIH